MSDRNCPNVICFEFQAGRKLLIPRQLVPGPANIVKNEGLARTHLTAGYGNGELSARAPNNLVIYRNVLCT